MELEHWKKSGMTAGTLAPKNVLFLGNSLLLGMFGLYGMCASSPHKDYAYYVQQELLKYNKECAFWKLHGGGFENAESIDAFEAWFSHEPDSYTGRPVRESFTGDIDLVFIQLGDNVNTDLKISVFAKTADMLIERVRGLASNARILWIHGWYNKNNTYDKLTALCSRWGIERVDISGLRTKENEARPGQLCENADGDWVAVSDNWITHPGDKGMREIARKIILAL